MRIVDRPRRDDGDEGDGDTGKGNVNCFGNVLCEETDEKTNALFECVRQRACADESSGVGCFEWVEVGARQRLKESTYGEEYEEVGSEVVCQFLALFKRQLCSTIAWMCFAGA